MKTKLILFHFLILVQNAFGNHKIGMVWVQGSFRSDPQIRLQEEKRVMSEIENREGKQVVRQNGDPLKIPQETFESEVKVGKIFDLVDQLSEENKFSENASIKLKKETGKVSPHFFSPELEKAYLKLSLQYWYQNNRELSRLFMKKALGLNPFFETKWQLPDDERVERHLFEVEFTDYQKKVSSEKSCRLQVPASLQHSFWINGFLVTQTNLRIKAGLFLMIKKEAQGVLSEKLLRCEGRDISLENKVWSPGKLGGRLEMLLPRGWRDFEETLVLQEKKGRVIPWLYRKEAGLVHLPLGLTKLTQVKDRPLEFVNLRQILPGEGPKKWYNNKTVVGVALGVLGAGMVIHKLFKTPDKPVFVPLIIK